MVAQSWGLQLKYHSYQSWVKILLHIPVQENSLLHVFLKLKMNASPFSDLVEGLSQAYEEEENPKLLFLHHCAHLAPASLLGQELAHELIENIWCGRQPECLSSR